MSDEQYDELVANFIRCHQNFSKKKHKIGSETLHGEMAVLFTLRENNSNGKTLSPSKISEKLCITRPSITSALNSLEAKGLIARSAAESDRRRSTIQITQEGIELADIGYNAMVNATKYIIESLGIEDAQKLVELLERVAKLINEYVGSEKTKEEKDI